MNGLRDKVAPAELAWYGFAMFRQAASPSLLVLLERWIRLCRECVVVLDRFFRHVLVRLFDDGLRLLRRCRLLLRLLLCVGVHFLLFLWRTHEVLRGSVSERYVPASTLSSVKVAIVTLAIKSNVRRASTTDTSKSHTKY